MGKNRNLFVKSLQAAVFVPSLDLSNKIALASELVDETGKLFAGEPVILPIPPDAPSEIPRIILKSKDDYYSMNISLNRFDFYYNEQSINKGLPVRQLSEIKTSFIDKLKKTTGSIKRVSGVKIVRLGFIPTLQVKINDASQIVNNAFLKPKRITNNLYDLNLGILKRAKLEQLKVNIWFRINPFRKAGDKLDNKLLIIRFDINTIPEELLDLQEKKVVNFFSSAYKYIEDNISSYINL